MAAQHKGLSTALLLIHVSPAVFPSTVGLPAAQAAVAAAGELSCSKATVTLSAIPDRAAIQTINTAVSWASPDSSVVKIMNSFLTKRTKIISAGTVRFSQFPLT